MTDMTSSVSAAPTEAEAENTLAQYGGPKLMGSSNCQVLVHSFLKKDIFNIMPQSAVVLENPKYPHNVGGALRACASFGATEFYWNGERVIFNVRKLPREERMRHYQQSVRFAQDQ